MIFFFFQAEDGIRDHCVTGVQTCALPISRTAQISKVPRDFRLIDLQNLNKKTHANLIVAHEIYQAQASVIGECFERSEEHTSELQSHSDLVCRLLLEKKKK